MAALADDLGFESFWFVDSHLIFRELYVVLGAVAAVTKRIAIGPGVTYPLARHPSVTASAVATLAELAPGRVHLGIGIGSSGPRNMGARPVSLKELEDSIRFIRELLAGREAERDGKRMRLAFASGEPIPVYVAAASDRTHRMSGRVADGAIITAPIDGLAASVAAVREGERVAGRPPGSVRTVLHVPCCLDADEAVARASVRGMVARIAMVSLARAARLGTIDPRDREALACLEREYDFYRHLAPEHGHLVEESWIDRFSMAGPPALVLERCEQALAAGAAGILLAFQGAAPERQMAEFAREVMAPLREAAKP